MQSWRGSTAETMVFEILASPLVVFRTSDTGSFEIFGALDRPSRHATPCIEPHVLRADDPDLQIDWLGALQTRPKPSIKAAVKCVLASQEHVLGEIGSCSEVKILEHMCAELV